MILAMETHPFTLEVELETRTIELDVQVIGHWDNDGIGSYEFWGQKCYDKGTSYFGVDEVTFDKTGFTPEEVKLIELAIENKTNEFAEEIAS